MLRSLVSSISSGCPKNKLLQHFRKVQWHFPCQEVLEVDFCFAKFSGLLLQAGSRHRIGHSASHMCLAEGPRRKAHHLPGSSDQSEAVVPTFHMPAIAAGDGFKTFWGQWSEPRTQASIDLTRPC